MNIADLRTTYRRATLAEGDVDADPFVQFDRWLAEAIAAQALEPTAMTLATVDAGGRPSARVVLLKGLAPPASSPTLSPTPSSTSSPRLPGRGFVWFTNYESRKGRELASRADAALCFFWPELERQVRIEGHVEMTSAEESDRYFASRPVESRIGAWASPQSEVITSRAQIEALEHDQRVRFQVADDTASIDIPRPAHWGGYRLIPDLIEFWQGRPSRLHDRIVYRGGDGSWTRARLAP